MAAMEVKIEFGDGVLMPDPMEVTVAPGATVTFLGDQSQPAVLNMSPKTGMMLGLAPGAQVPAGGSLTVKFAETASGSPRIVLGFPGKTSPPLNDSSHGSTLHIDASGPSDAPWPEDSPDPGTAP